MKEISKDYIKEENTEMLAKEELQQFLKFQKAFAILYEENKIPYMRVWQCGSIENSYDVGMVLKRMRMAQEKTQEEVCIDEKGFSFFKCTSAISYRKRGKSTIYREFSIPDP